MTYLQYAKTGIHIKKSHRGRFTKYCHGEVTNECIQRGKHSPSAAVRRLATFAENARKWKHQEGGTLGKSTIEYTPTGHYTDVIDPEDYINPLDLYIQETSTQVTDATDLTEFNKLFEGVDLQVKKEQSKSSDSYKITSTPKDLKERQIQAMNYLISKGFTKAGTAGIVGVLTAESGLIPGRLNDIGEKHNPGRSGRGIAQWAGSRRLKYEEYFKNKEINLKNELDYFINDLKSRPLVWNIVTSTNSVEDATKAMHLGFENGSAKKILTALEMFNIYEPHFQKLYNKHWDYNTSHGKRYKFAQTAYNLI